MGIIAVLWQSRWENSSQGVVVGRRQKVEPLTGGGAEVFCCGHWTLTTDIVFSPDVVASAAQRERTVTGGGAE